LFSARGDARWLHVQGVLECFVDGSCAHDNIRVSVGSAFDRDLRFLRIYLLVCK
jgi:hypothetical protein